MHTKATHREKTGKGFGEAEQEKPTPVVVPVVDPLSEEESPSAEEAWAEDAEEDRLRRIYDGEDEEDEYVWEDLRDAAKLLDVCITLDVTTY